jgi:hypothetical protein
MNIGNYFGNHSTVSALTSGYFCLQGRTARDSNWEYYFLDAQYQVPCYTGNESTLAAI